jgi:CMP/dCMP kinase
VALIQVGRVSRRCTVLLGAPTPGAPPHSRALRAIGTGDEMTDEQPAANGFAGVIALDGPSGTGKSTVARRLADRLGARYLDTGAMYRAVTLAVLRAGVDPDAAPAVDDVAAAVVLELSTDPREPATWLDGQRVDAEIRSDEVTAAVSAVSAIASVRQRLVVQQRELIAPGAIVVEGRDIGTVVWPQARPKVYLTAEAQVRARRRAAELATDEVSAVAAAISRRDGYDSTRPTSPLTQAADAVELDTTNLSIDQVVQRLVDMTTAVMSDQ